MLYCVRHGLGLGGTYPLCLLPMDPLLILSRAIDANHYVTESCRCVRCDECRGVDDGRCCYSSSHSVLSFIALYDSP